ncbi:MAG TPA: hypothetical protein VMT69_02725 [Kineosporiaceae bacterium]|nr:hypothetical protein [Kineosporiaceae bacterium]
MATGPHDDHHIRAGGTTVGSEESLRQRSSIALCGTSLHALHVLIVLIVLIVHGREVDVLG